ncbi:MAG: DUF2779 domain-containing protein, partial [Flavobacteriales bacterium]
PDAGRQAIFSAGTSVGILAQQLFPGGVDCTPPTYRDFEQSVLDTERAIVEGAQVIYEAAFLRDGVLAAMDLLVRTDEGWKAYEVKGSTGVKDVYINDAALQSYVIEGSIPLVDVSIVYLNNRYVKQGPIDVQALFTIVSVKERVALERAHVPARIEGLKAVLLLPEAPVIDIGPHCDTPYHCDFKAHCWAHVPSPSVFNLTRAGDKKWELYGRGILRLSDIPAEEPLRADQRRQVDACISGTVSVDREPLRKWLDALRYPLHHFDFETMNAAVPLYDGTRPFQQLPFQYSLHLQTTPSGPAEHHEFLADGSGDPREELVQQLLEDIGPEGDILAYYAPFERSRLAELARDLPHHAAALTALLPRIRDLMDPFKMGWYYAPGMNGSNSIKAVLPALVPELDYHDLNIQEGATASMHYSQLAAGTYEGDAVQLRADLLAYCQLDTLAMVRVLAVLEGSC